MTARGTLLFRGVFGLIVLAVSVAAASAGLFTFGANLGGGILTGVLFALIGLLSACAESFALGVARDAPPRSASRVGWIAIGLFGIVFTNVLQINTGWTWSLRDGDRYAQIVREQNLARLQVDIITDIDNPQQALDDALAHRDLWADELAEFRRLERNALRRCQRRDTYCDAAASLQRAANSRVDGFYGDRTTRAADARRRVIEDTLKTAEESVATKRRELDAVLDQITSDDTRDRATEAEKIDNVWNATRTAIRWPGVRVYDDNGDLKLEESIDRARWPIMGLVFLLAIFLSGLSIAVWSSVQTGSTRRDDDDEPVAGYLPSPVPPPGPPPAFVTQAAMVPGGGGQMRLVDGGLAPVPRNSGAYAQQAQIEAMRQINDLMARRAELAQQLEEANAASQARADAQAEIDEHERQIAQAERRLQEMRDAPTAPRAASPGRQATRAETRDNLPSSPPSTPPIDLSAPRPAPPPVQSNDALERLRRKVQALRGDA